MDAPGPASPDPQAPAGGQPAPPPEPVSRSVPTGPLERTTALALLAKAANLLDDGEFAESAAYYQRIVGFPEAEITGEALLGLGEALYRLDRDDDALRTWESILQLPESAATYQAWRRVASARVRDGDLRGAMAAYREADRRAPPEDKAEIASRLGWLSKETGDRRAAGRYFSRSRGDGPPISASNAVLGITVVISFLAMTGGGAPLFDQLELDKVAIAAGEYWRIWSVTLLHANLLHLLFNMYALYLVGPIVERQYGWRWFLALYLLCAAGGSIATFALGPGRTAVGASGAIFGLFGVLIAATRTHRPVLDRQARQIVPQLGTIVVLNLVLGFVIPNIDNLAHLGGLVTGLWLGYLIPPGQVPTLAGLWQHAPDSGSALPRGLVQVVGLVVLVAALGAGTIMGTSRWQVPPSARGTVAVPVAVAPVATHGREASATAGTGWRYLG